MKNQMIVRRESNADTAFAVVQWNGCKYEEFGTALKKAVAKWVQTTEEGADAWNETQEDLNIYDLSMMLGDEPELNTLLAEQGVHDLEIDVFYDPRTDVGFSYDIVLYSEAIECTNI